MLRPNECMVGWKAIEGKVAKETLAGLTNGSLTRTFVLGLSPGAWTLNLGRTCEVGDGTEHFKLKAEKLMAFGGDWMQNRITEHMVFVLHHAN